jgi:uncharacterized membrane protein YphA (DoxX/SURF4 family)
MEVDGETAAVLANLGVITPATPTPGTDPGAPVKPLPPPAGDSKPAPKDGSANAGPAEARIVRAAWQDGGKGAPAGAGQGTTSAPPGQAGTYTAADFPDKIKVKPVYLLAAMIHNAAHPKPTPENPNPMALWPASLASGRLPVIIAWLVLAAELGGGVLVALGLCTRLAALSLVGVMAGAMWLTQIGPAVASGHTVLGFLPDYPRYGMEWTTLLLQFVLFCMALALLFSGPGFMAADHALFGGRRKTDDHDGE